MQWPEFIFSEITRYKVMRHIAFWVLWWLYFMFTYWLLQQPIPGSSIIYLTPGDHLTLKITLLVLLFVIGCYPVINYVFAQIIRGKWLKATGYFLLICLFICITSYFLYWNIFSFIDSSFGISKPNIKGTRFWLPFNLGIMNFIKVCVAAVSIKYVKYWWQKQKEVQRLEKKKINAELQLLKAQVHPDFLFKTLNNIYTHALNSNPRTTEMLLKLSDLLSYMLYECDIQEVSVKKEIEMMRDYMQLEKIRYNDEPEIQVNIKGELDSQVIAPFLLLPFIESSFKYGGQKTEKFWINMDIRIQDNHFTMKLANSISKNIAEPGMMQTNGLAGVQKRLDLLYPGKHALKMSIEQEMNIVLLDIHLGIVFHTGLDEQEDYLVSTPSKRQVTTIFKYATD